jgi:hypothetical protein
MNDRNIRDLLMIAPDDQVDAALKPLIAKWDTEPTSLQVLEVLDLCIFGGAATGFVVRLLETLYDVALQAEHKVHADNLPFATWRDNSYGS